MSNNNPYNIQIKHHYLGNDITFLITGGKAHIGAIASAYWDNDKVQAKMIELPHHKEGQLAKECAEIATYSLGVSTTVVMGIHIDQATKKQISEIVTFVQKEMRDTIQQIQIEKS